MRRQLLAASILAGLAVTACSEGRAQDNGPAAGRNYQVGAFTGIEVAGPFDVNVTTGKPVAVSAQGSERVLDALEVKVDGDKLFIRTRRGGWLNGMTWGSRDKVVFTVSVPSLAVAGIAGSGNLRIDQVSGDSFKGGIAGSGNLTVGRLAVRDLDLGVAGSGDATVAGQTQRAKYGIAGSGNLDASGLRATDAEAEIAGSGSIRAQVTGTAKASIAGSGDIDIRGGARCQSSKNGSGNIRCS
jgi:hypothetical protein